MITERQNAYENLPVAQVAQFLTDTLDDRVLINAHGLQNSSKAEPI
jgi:hypothetical protein